MIDAVHTIERSQNRRTIGELAEGHRRGLAVAAGAFLQHADPLVGRVEVQAGQVVRDFSGCACVCHLKFCKAVSLLWQVVRDCPHNAATSSSVSAAQQTSPSCLDHSWPT